MNRFIRSMAVTGSLILVGTSAAAVTGLSDPLTGYTGTSQTDFPAQPASLSGSGLEASFVWSGGDGAWEKIKFSSSGMLFGDDRTDTTGRNYIRTTEQGYDTVSFSAFVTVDRPDIPDTAGVENPSVFFGLGNAALGSGKRPDDGQPFASTYLEFQDGYNNASWRVSDDINVNNLEVGWTPISPASGVSGLTRLKMDYDAITQTVTYSADYAYDGTFAVEQVFATFSVADQAAEWAGGDRASIYFGGDRKTLFTDFDVVVTVIPEPSSLALMILTVSAGWMVRRRSRR